MKRWRHYLAVGFGLWLWVVLIFAVFTADWHGVKLDFSTPYMQYKLWKGVAILVAVVLFGLIVGWRS
jgi:hypothetical protein